jgi:hypothetical protein
MTSDSPIETPAEPAPTGEPPRPRWIGLVVVAILVVGVIVYRQLGTRVDSETPSTVGTADGAGSVLLFADPAEAETSCGCGQIIRLVRGANARGLAVREVAPSSDSALER